MRQDDLCVRIRGDEFFGEKYRRHIRHALTVTEQLIELGSTVWLALAIILGFYGFHPHLVVARVLEERLPTMVTFIDAQKAKRGACRCVDG